MRGSQHGFMGKNMRKKIDIVGARFGKLVIIGEHSRKWNNIRILLAQCDCGKTSYPAITNLRAGRSLSCGCLSHRGATTHGKTKTLSYGSWCAMRGRCLDPNNNQYKNYGSRGVKICTRWNKFENFYEDMGERPGKTWSIDRIDPFGNYEPKNCRRATPKEQANNTRRKKHK